MLSVNTNESHKTESILNLKPDFRSMLLSRHGEHDTICVSAYGMKGGKFVVKEYFCNGVAEAADLIARCYENPSIGAIWTNLQKLKPGSHRRKKGETTDAYTNILVDIDRRWKMIHEDGSVCQHPNNKDCGAFKANASDAEVEVLRGAAEKINGFLSKLGDAVFAFSGNGFHISWRCVDGTYTGPRRPGYHWNPLVPKDGAELYKRLLNLLRRKFEKPDLNMEIDVSLADETQVVTAWGTWNRKYPDLLERPQRQSKVLYMPSLAMEPVKKIDLELFLIENAPNGEETPEFGRISPNSGDDKLQADPEWLENCGVPHLIEHFRDYITYENEAYDKGGDVYHPITPCFCHEGEPDGRQHSHAKDCCIIEWADGGIGVSCFSRDFGLKTMIKRLNDKIIAVGGQKYPFLIYQKTEEEIAAERRENAEAAAALGVEAVPTPISMVVPEHEKPEELFESKPQIELWKMPEDCMYGWLGEQAKALGAPLSLAYPTILCVFAGQGVGKSGSVRGNLYGLLIGAKGTGKTRTIDRALDKLEYEYPRQIKKRYPGSEHGLILTLDGKKPKDMTDLDWTMTKPFLLVQDEYRNTFGKMSIDNSALPYAINHLFNQNEYEAANAKGSMVCIAQLSMIGGLTAENAEDFSEVFGKATTNGTYDRFIFGVAPPSWNWDDEWEQTAVPVRRLPKLVNIPSEIYAMKRKWQEKEPEIRRRLGELALRIALVTASANGDPHITEECMAAALRLAEWQQAIRSWYKPSEMDDKDGLCQEAIERILERMGRGTKDGWVQWGGREGAKRKGNLSRHGAARVVRIFKGMVEFGMVEEEKETVDDDGNPTAGKAKTKTGRVRLKRD